MAKIPAGYVEALWVGPHEATTPDRPIYKPDSDPPEIIGELPAQYLIPGETTCIVPAGEAETSENWKPTASSHKGGQNPKAAPAPVEKDPGQ